MTVNMISEFLRLKNNNHAQKFILLKFLKHYLLRAKNFLIIY